MSKTDLRKAGGFTPVIDGLVERHGAITALVFGRVWRFCQGRAGVCSASLGTIAGSLHLDRTTVWRHLRRLVKAGYLQDLTPHQRQRPHIYLDTELAQQLAAARAGGEDNASGADGSED